MAHVKKFGMLFVGVVASLFILRFIPAEIKAKILG